MSDAVYHEVAIDPGSVTTFGDLHRIMLGFGFNKGRLVSHFPKKGPSKKRSDETWGRMVVENIKQNDPKNAKRAQTLLEYHGKNLLLSAHRRRFTHDREWLKSARESHKDEPFDAILTEDGEKERGEYHLNDLEMPRDNGVPDALCEGLFTMSVGKDFRQLAPKLRPLLHSSNEILLVDHYFNPSMKKWQASLKEITRVIAGGFRCETVIIEYHFVRDERKRPNVPVQDLLDECREHCAHLIPDKIRKGVKFIMHGLRPGQPRFHARYILSERAGVGIEYGLDHSAQENRLTDLYRLNKEQSRDRMKNYRDGEFYENLGEVTVKGL